VVSLKPPVSVLLVEDSTADAQLVCDILAFARQPGYRIRHVTLVSAALEAIAVEAFDVVLLDLGLPDSVGLEGLAAIRRVTARPAIVVRTGLGDERVALDALEAGAQDYIVKGLGERSDALERSIQYALARRQADASRQQLAAIVESSFDAILSTDNDGTLMSFNPGAERLFGYRGADVLGQPASLLVPADGADEWRAVMQRALDGGPVEHHETRLRRQDGRAVDVAQTISPICDADGTVIGASAVVRDITKRKAAERRLADAARFFDVASDMVCTIDRDRRFVELNGRWEDTLGWPPSELGGRVCDELVHPQDAAAMTEALTRLRDDSPSEQFVTRFAAKDGGWRWIEWSVSAGAEHSLHYAAARDITARVKAQEATRAAEARFVQVFADAPIGMALAGLDGRIRRANAAMEDITGHAGAVLEGMALEALADPLASQGHGEALRDMLAGLIAGHRAERTFVHADGRPIPVDVSLTLLRAPDGRPRDVLCQVLDVSERKRFEGQLQYLADHDPLTGMFNRRRFDSELHRELARARRYGTPCALLAIDLDHFKLVNDTHGHPVGDELITRTAAVLRARLRESDVLSRLGGDEFAVLLPSCARDEALQVAGGLLEALRAESLVPGAGSRRVSASIGVALFDPASELTPQELMVEADIAMYDAKEGGRNSARVFDPARHRHARMEARLNWMERIRRALDDERFVLHAQPIVSLSGGTDVRHELLIRMEGSDGDLVPPGTFLYIAERFDLIQEIDRWVLRKAIAMLAARRAAGIEQYLAVNLSAKSITDPGLIEYIATELERAGVDGSGLCIEITETAAIVNVARAKAFAAALRALGCTLALDDFGAGFASFYYLKHLSFDYVKIDGEFIRDVVSSRVNQLVVRSVVGIARGLGKHTIAEFVGDEETVELLRGYGVDYAQGFHVGRPKPLEAVGLALPASDSDVGACQTPGP